LVDHGEPGLPHRWDGGSSSAVEFTEEPPSQPPLTGPLNLVIPYEFLFGALLFGKETRRKIAGRRIWSLASSDSAISLIPHYKKTKRKEKKKKIQKKEKDIYYGPNEATHESLKSEKNKQNKFGGQNLNKLVCKTKHDRNSCDPQAHAAGTIDLNKFSLIFKYY